MTAIGQSWGRYPRTNQQLVPWTNRHAELKQTDLKQLPYGNGRSYGDSCLNDGGVLLHTRGTDRLIAFDPRTGVLTCESGVLFAEILDLVVTQGWFLPVTPGTRYVTIGGAIANDVHGKNHHRAGSFGHHLLAFELLRSDGSRLRCSPTENAEWFAATLGGLGLTGLITWASVQLRRISSPAMVVESHKFGSLPEFFALSKVANQDDEYVVAWIDCVARGSSLGRGLLSSGNHAPASAETRIAGKKGRLRIPVTPPLSLINPLSLRAFNALYYHRQRQQVSRTIAHYEPYFYPLDSIGEWNRIYGPRGFLQYQCVIPPAVAETVTTALVKAISASGKGSFLAVLKQFGELPSLGMLSFPRPGTTLALDFPNEGERTHSLLDRLDDMVAEAGGAVYPAKDARMPGHRFRQYFPAWESFSRFIDPRFSSSFWRRVTE